MKIVIVTGSREWTTVGMAIALSAALDKINPDIVVHGGALGADTMAHNWCSSRAKIAVVYFPDYKAYDRKAPLVRNLRMLDDYPEATVVACPLPGSRGTFHTMSGARERGMEVVKVDFEKGEKACE